MHACMHTCMCVYTYNYIYRSKQFQLCSACAYAYVHTTRVRMCVLTRMHCICLHIHDHIHLKSTPTASTTSTVLDQRYTCACTGYLQYTSGIQLFQQETTTYASQANKYQCHRTKKINTVPIHTKLASSTSCHAASIIHYNFVSAQSLEGCHSQTYRQSDTAATRKQSAIP